MALFGLFHRSKDGVETPLEIENIMPDENAPAKPEAETKPEASTPLAPALALGFAETPEGRKMAADLATAQAELSRLTAEADANRKAKVRADADAFAASLAAPGALKIAADKQPVVASAYAQAAEDDRTSPLAEGSRVESLKAAFAAVPDASARFGASVNGKAVFAAESVARGGESETPDPANVARLMALAGLPG